MNYDIDYDIIGQCSIFSNAAVGCPRRGRASLRHRDYNMHYDNRQASVIKPLLVEQRRHVQCVGAGRHWAHAVRVRVTGYRFHLSPTGREHYDNIKRKE